MSERPHPQELELSCTHCERPVIERDGRLPREWRRPMPQHCECPECVVECRATLMPEIAPT